MINISNQVLENLLLSRIHDFLQILFLIIKKGRYEDSKAINTTGKEKLDNFFQSISIFLDLILLQKVSKVS